MKLVFTNEKITPKKIKINGKIKKAVEQYKTWKVPMKVLLTDFLAVKSKGDELANAENPWAYFYKGIEGHEVESGVSVDESLFRFAAMSIKDQMPTDVINAAFYANSRNDSDFEIGYLLPLFMSISSPSKNLLIVNPSPEIICAIESMGHMGKRFYAVTDKTVMGLYKIQFPKACFVTFEQMEKIHDIDEVLITNRDQKIQEAPLLLRSLFCCGDNTSVVALVPSAWFDNPQCGAYKTVKEAGFAVEQILIVDPKVTSSVPRKKILVFWKRAVIIVLT